MSQSPWTLLLATQWVAWVSILLHPTISASTSSSQAGGIPLVYDDFVVAMPGVSSRIKMAHATRSWRNNLRTAIVLENAELIDILKDVHPSEVYLVWPDEVSYSGSLTRDVRAAMIPVMAHRMFGGSGPRRGYKWMLYGDDDTVFFMDNVRSMLQLYDHTQPYMISDNLWWNHTHHNFEAPRCLPCHVRSPETEAAVLNATQHGTSYRPPWGCPYCTVKKACQWYWDRMPKLKEEEEEQASPDKPSRRQLKVHATQEAEQRRRAMQEAEKQGVEPREARKRAARPPVQVVRDWELWSHMPNAPPAPPGGIPIAEDVMFADEDPTSLLAKARRRACHHTVGHGGAGVILSSGLMERIDMDQFVACVRKLRACSGGDCRFAVCVQDVVGIAFTDPGHSVFAGKDKLRTIFDNEPLRQTRRLPSESVARGLCDEVCLFQVANAVSSHIKARSHHSVNMAAAHMYFATHSHRAAQQYLALGEQLRGLRLPMNHSGHARVGRTN